jgi:hypothetical protein
MRHKTEPYHRTCLRKVRLKAPGHHGVMMVLLRIVHDHSNSVPENLTILEVTDVAKLAVRYDYLDISRPYFERWLEGGWSNRWIKDDISLSGYDDFRVWLALSWMLKRQDEFENLTCMIIIQFRGPPIATGLQIHTSIVGKFLFTTLFASSLSE